ncbi:hypothetical protein BOR84_01450 [Corynebacterium striatum]|uniref:YbjN domain-containing protein n=1 Tax=Corynebacterium striatum TaxID=43770 RepID=A0ABC8CQ06_CORST|nr:hypothetical protein A9D01_02320 [Corynebacterium striatum]EGT5611564.1 hypothetical protein [Corynebacterium striatum]
MKSTSNQSLASPDLHQIKPVNIHRLAELFELLEADYVLVDKVSESGSDGDLDDTAEKHAEKNTESSTGPSLGDALVLQTGLPHITIHFDLEDDVLSAFAVWEGRIPARAEAKVGAFVSHFNWNMAAPTLSYDFRVKGNGAPTDKEPTEEIAICANRAMGVGEGLTRNQLGSFVLSALDSFGSAFETVAQEFPQSVKWQEKENVHQSPAARKKGQGR